LIERHAVRNITYSAAVHRLANRLQGLAQDAIRNAQSILQAAAIPVPLS
jgi:hypothetical protein